MSTEFEPACRRMEWLDPFYKSVWEKAFADAIPISGTFELTPRCNFNCRMCYVHLKLDQIPKYGRELTAKEWIRIAEEAKEAGTTWLCVTGGEPLMHPEFETIWKELCSMGFFITLQTNASLIKGKMADLLAKYPPRGAKITLYGSSDEVYEKVCRVKNGFTDADAGIRTLCEMKIPVQLISTVIRQNEDDIKRMAFYAYIHGLKWEATGKIKKSVRGAQNNIDDVRIIGDSKKSDTANRNININSGPKMDMSRKPCTYCRDYRVGYWILWDGRMSFCSFINEMNISIREKDFYRAWKTLIDFEDTLDWPDECKNCILQKQCMKCAATLATECGSIYKISKDFCDREFRKVKRRN